MVEAKQINVEGSRTTAAAEEAQSKLERLDSSTDGCLASKHESEIAGVKSEELGGPDRNLLGVTGDGADGRPVNRLHENFGNANLISPAPVKEPMTDVMEDEPLLIKEDETEPMLQTSISSSIPRGLDTTSEPAVDTVETRKPNRAMEMETKRNTYCNLSPANAKSSCKTKTAEWALLITSMVLEAISAIFDQLGYALTSMVMAFVALVLSILDLIHKARERGITCDGRGLLPCLNRHPSHDSQNRKPFASLVEYFGLAVAVWQCSFAIIGYHYTRKKLVNPIKLCLLPFIFALCVLVSKVVKSSQHEP